jgi:iron complex outermembrane receptor protein
LARSKSPAALPVMVALSTCVSGTNIAKAQALEELTVTARKTEESLQDVPISITAFSADQLLEIGAFDNEDVALLTVNFNSVSQIGRRLDRPVVRGQAAPATFGEPNASYFIDGVYVSGTIAAATLGPVERVEILRGPQSTQFGRATFSGAINYVTRKPTNEYTGEVLVRGGNNDSRVVSAWGSGPVVKDKLLFFASASWDQYGGQWNNALAEGTASIPDNFVDPPQQADFSDLGATETRQAVGKLLWNVTDSAEITFKLGYLEGEDSHYPQLIVSPDELNCFVPGADLQEFENGVRNLNYFKSPGQYCGAPDYKGRVSSLNIPDLNSGMTSTFYNPDDPATAGFKSEATKAGLDREQYNALLQYDQGFGNWNMTARLAANRDELKTAYDLEGTPKRTFLGLFHFYEEVVRKDSSFDLRIDSPAESRTRGSLGFYYFDFEEDARQKSHVGINQGLLSSPTIQNTENIAVYGALEFDATEKLTLTAEARWAEDTKKIKSPNSCNDAPPSTYDPDGKFFAPGVPIEHEETTTAVTPRFTARYFATSEAMVYIQAAKGNKPGAFNRGIYSDGRNGCQTQLYYFGGEQLANDGVTRIPVTPIAFVEEENAWTWEIGSKTSWLDERIRANIAVFYIDWDNLTAFETRQVQLETGNAFSPPIPQSLGLNAGNAEVKGLEIETTFAITAKLTATFNYGFNDGQYTEYASKSYANTTGDGLIYAPPEGFDPDPNNTTDFDPRYIQWDESVNNLAGKAIPNSSQHNFVTSLAYNDQFTAELGWFARTDFIYESKKYTSGTNFEEIDARKLWNIRAGLDHANWRLALFVNNILDNQTPSAIIGFVALGESNAGGTNPTQYALTPTPGRQVGAELVWRFGN